MSWRWMVVMAATLVLTAPAGAHEEGIYESLHHIPIGRIFLSRDERERLDRYRDAGPPTEIIDRSSKPQAPAKPDKAAGFIVSNSGTRSVWRNGDFVRTNSSREVRFPGDVEVERVKTRPAREDAAEEHEAEREEE